MRHPTLRELSEAVHGLGPRPSHDCPDCAARVDALEGELELLRRAEARVPPPAATSQAWRRLPVALAAALLLGVLGWILARPGAPPAVVPAAQEDPVSRFLDGDEAESAAAREVLVKRGPLALGSLTEARRKRPDAARADSLALLITELKRREGGADAFDRLEIATVTLDMQDAPLSAVLDYLREVLKVEFLADPLKEYPTVSLKVQDMQVRRALDVLARLAGYEYAWRWGVIFFAPPEKLWGPAALPTANRWRTQTPGEAGRATALKLAALRLDLSFEDTPGAEVVGFLRDVSSLQVVLEKPADFPDVSLGARNATLGEIVERLTLPRGYDARLDEGTLVLYRK